LRAYFQAVETGDLVPLTSLLSENVVLWADGGGKTVAAVLRPIRGRATVARVSLWSRRFWPANYRVALEEVNGQAAIIVRAGDQAFCVVAVDVEDGQVQTIRIIANPEKLARV
ncbi:MAG TPA: RNA polymerase subunit sigma-24, partial [Chloroflexia bacterium]|nr:RNA polymerase subunit sigma-24 [Chloroflexia bacterium]